MLRLTNLPVWFCAAVAALPLAVNACFAQELPPEVAVGGASEDYEILTRGPLHEAFAESYSAAPEPGILVAKQPPPDVEEVSPPVRPGQENLQWIPGYWAWDDERADFVWVSGVWRAAPPGRRWTPGYWAEVEGGYRWAPGLWADAASGDVLYRQTPPESLERGPAGPAPSDRHFWIPGCWLPIAEQYKWRPGYWHAYEPDWVWIPSQYIWSPCGSIYVAGYWDYRILRRGCVFAPVYFRRPVWLNPNYYYRPSCIINDAALAIHLFIRPSYHHYYFGDYYGLAYQQRSIYPCFEYHRSYPGYEPLYQYNRLHYGLRGIDFDSRSRAWYDHLCAFQSIRPPRTLGDQHRYESAHRNDSYLQHNVLAQRLDDSFLTSHARWSQLKQQEQLDVDRALADFRSQRRHRSEQEQAAVGRGPHGLDAGRLSTAKSAAAWSITDQRRTAAADDPSARRLLRSDSPKEAGVANLGRAGSPSLRRESSAASEASSTSRSSWRISPTDPTGGRSDPLGSSSSARRGAEAVGSAEAEARKRLDSLSWRPSASPANAAGRSAEAPRSLFEGRTEVPSTAQRRWFTAPPDGSRLSASDAAKSLSTSVAPSRRPDENDDRWKLMKPRVEGLSGSRNARGGLPPAAAPSPAPSSGSRILAQLPGGAFAAGDAAVGPAPDGARRVPQRVDQFRAETAVHSEFHASQLVRFLLEPDGARRVPQRVEQFRAEAAVHSEFHASQLVRFLLEPPADARALCRLKRHGSFRGANQKRRRPRRVSCTGIQRPARRPRLIGRRRFRKEGITTKSTKNTKSAKDTKQGV